MPDVILGGFVGFVIGIVVGVIIWYYMGSPRCEHNWEKILDDKYPNDHIIVHMCKKCGKRKITKV